MSIRIRKASADHHPIIISPHGMLTQTEYMLVSFHMLDGKYYRCRYSTYMMCHNIDNDNKVHYILCLKTRQVYFIVTDFLVNPDVYRLDSRHIRSFINAEVMEVYRLKMINRIRKIYNKIRLVLHSDIVRHIVLLLVQKIEF
jgi:hypothetical protein